jgi:hypothetical protein
MQVHKNYFAVPNADRLTIERNVVAISLPTLTEEVRHMATPQGQPTSYKPEYCELAHNYCLLGATNEELAGFFDVVRRTIDNWIATHPEFAKAVHDGRAVADGVIARSLFARAKGFKHEVTRITLHQGEEREVTNIVEYPPDTQACIFWLRNRRRQSWSAKAEETPASVVDEVALLDAAGERARHAPVE